MDQIQSVWCNNQGTVYILGQYCSWLLLSFSTLISFLAGLVLGSMFFKQGVQNLLNNQHNQRNFLNFENWTIGEPQWLAKIRVSKVEYVL